jgi:superfamily I DNA/RNA helicase
VFNFEQLHLQGGMTQEKGGWDVSFQRKFKDKEKVYFRKLLNNETNLDDKANIIIDTIHQVKGGEADHVVLSAKCNFPSHFDRKNLEERIKELRVWYTGVTRTINTLHLLGTYHKYHFPLSKYYKLYKSNYA